MALVDHFLDLVSGHASRAFQPGEPASDALLALLVHVAFSDGALADGELAFLERILPGRKRDELATWVHAVGATPLDVAAIARALPSVDERWKGLRFAARMAWKDGAVQPAERALLEQLEVGLDMPRGATERVLDEVHGVGEEVDSDKLSQVLQDMSWDSVQLAQGPVESDLAGTVPDGLKPVARVGLDGVEAVIVLQQGLVARFLEGPAFVRWSDIVAYTRVPVFGAAVQVHTEDGRTLTLVDSRLRGVAVLLDRLFGRTRSTSAPPRIEQVRGEEG